MKAMGSSTKKRSRTLPTRMVRLTLKLNGSAAMDAKITIHQNGAQIFSSMMQVLHIACYQHSTHSNTSIKVIFPTFAGAVPASAPPMSSVAPRSMPNRTAKLNDPDASTFVP